MRILKSYWHMLIFRGIAAIAFGILAIAWPGLTILALVLLFGAYAVVDGITMLIGVATKFPGMHRGWSTLMGIVSLAAGIVTFVWPDITALALLYVIATWSIVIGAIQVFVAVRYSREMTREWLLALGGVLGVVVGVCLFIWPGDGALALTWVIGWFAIVAGAFMIGEALRVRRVDRALEGIIGPSPTPMRRSHA
jgi:uncharacterized membrane protein HdeD (DUF308 family)